ncbi:MAG: hypothetical protein KAI57_02570 [Candidatus Pacebacteria bacterium]|nr:hypothetical protein [Candidatus Paceibacterota bacterium]
MTRSKLYVVEENEFENLLKKKLGDSYGRALKVLRDYGASVSWDIANVLLQAVNKQKVSEVLNILENHFKKIDLGSQHPDARGVYKSEITEAMFMKICNEILELKPNKS